MEYRRMGSTGLKVSELCMGTMQFGWSVDEQGSFEILDEAVAAGINFIDTADVYSRWIEGNPGGVSETILGNWMRQRGIPRHSLVIATKVNGRMGDGPNDAGLSRAHIMLAVEESLRRLQTDYIDLYQAHSLDPETPVEETLSAFDALVRQGKVRYVGCSNYPAWRLMQALWASDRHGLARYDCLQPHYNLVRRQEFEQELSEVCQTYGLGVIPYSPLAAGFLTGKYRREQTQPETFRHRRASTYINEKNFAMLDVMDEVGRSLGDKTPSQVALAWLLSQPVVTSPIIGPRTMEQLRDNLGAAGLRLHDGQLQKLNEASARN